MGYGKTLKELLDDRGMTVKELATKAGIAPTTIYSIIQRDAAIRFDTALRIANILDCPINAICKDNPYKEMDIETLPKLPKDNQRIMIDAQKRSYISERTAKILKKFDYSSLPMVDQLIADLFVLDDSAREDLFDYVQMIKKKHTDTERAKELKKIK